MVQPAGPLGGLRVVELAGLGPVPHAGMVLADLGADVVRVDRPPRAPLSPAAAAADEADPFDRGRSVLRLDLKSPAGRDAVLGLAEAADVLLEGFRPGVTERLGLGPDEVLARNPRLVYGRMTGWGQDGPMAARAGHDINYLSLTGALHAIGREGEPPPPPLNLVADFGGGSMLLVVGVLAALREAERTGRGQVVDAAMVDGVGLLLQLVRGMQARGHWTDRRDANLLDGHAPFYDTYACADGGFVAVGALEPAFYAELLQGLGLDPQDLPAQYDRSGWPLLRERLTAVLATRTRDEWAEHFAGTDACLTPVLGLDEAERHPHLAARGAIVSPDGVRQAAPAPRFSGTPTRLPPPAGAADLDDVLRRWRGGHR